MTMRNTDRSAARRTSPRPFTRIAGPAVAAAVLASSAAGAPPEERLKDSDHKKIGKVIAAYFEAKTESEGTAEAIADVQELLDKTRKKLKGVEPLSLVEDLERALYYANNYPKKKIRKGKGRIDEWALEDAYFGELPLVLRAPKSYSAGKGPYPLILTIPDEGQSGRDHLQMDWTDADVADQAILVTFEMPASAETWTEIGTPEEPGGLGLVMASFGTLTKTFAVDMDRVYLCGRGAGVTAALSIASQYPHCFAGVAGRVGDAGEVATANFANTATFFSGGGAGCTAFEKAIGEAGYGNCTLKPDGTEADLWAWMQEVRRDPMPARIVFEPFLRAKTAFWLQAEGFEEGSARIEASADRGTNTIEITGEGVSTVNLYFSDLLVDMSQPIKVVVNGTVHEDLVPPNLQAFLTYAYRNGDTGRVFTSNYSYNLPQTADDATQ